ncbi:thiamine diphosphokinase [Butyrivibrio sp. MC2013]|uniref:thiamine diphosphokinase n=1 Tax=Butyrivibrio sp. MC2013 TaxID=1280686 RepID=UPI0003FE36A9|nr:thiamine diphosphokinase [Butyrivibrio sp. MC2013]
MAEAKCVIVAAGSFVPVELDRADGDYLIACDRGFRYLNLMGILPDLIIGDFDSLKDSPDDLRSMAEIAASDPDRIIRLSEHKDDTDTMAAVKEGFKRGYRKFYIYGALGGNRVSHSLANIQTLLYIKHRGGKGYIMDEKSMIMVAEDEKIDFKAGMTGYLSVFALGDKAEHVTIKDMEYEMEDGIITADFPIGVSNSFLADRAGSVEVQKGSLLIVAEW